MGQSANQNAGYDTSDLESSYAYGFMGVLTISIIMTVFIVSGLFAFLTDFESGGKVVDDPIMAAAKEAHAQSMRRELEAQYSEVFKDKQTVEEQVAINLNRISVNGFVRPIDPPQPTLEGVDVLSPLHSGGQPNQFTIGRENIRRGNEALARDGKITKAFAAVVAEAKSKPVKVEAPAGESSGGR
jgi:hypothetical protein